eukprot:TRINITY_DN90417_c0_g1_i1.p1 TRINITY_DN90417_c0_g1~~TRINITY_DN90417_c0_g1_i1.p1  ORF type:complete len:219 (-),score=36.59 TRINITY_DN90417_c0_g1_i1:306-962(-)
MGPHGTMTPPVHEWTQARSRLCVARGVSQSALTWKPTLPSGSTGRSVCASWSDVLEAAGGVNSGLSTPARSSIGGDDIGLPEQLLGGAYDRYGAVGIILKREEEEEEGVATSSWSSTRFSSSARSSSDTASHAADDVESDDGGYSCLIISSSSSSTYAQDDYGEVDVRRVLYGSRKPEDPVGLAAEKSSIRPDHREQWCRARRAPLRKATREDPLGLA